ncbi:CBS domain-containing protein [Anoxybacterium hadale]|uniref:CBS domain-containing protein n=1 Tax=Anoxybacterium hadale TaxID=3408580 RepID=A0ACD1AA46_9FIRM|nr:CBS domain-containing protein [Clostridiales bacterium]
MDEWKKILIPADTEIQKTIEMIDKNGMQIAFVVDREQKLLGTVTDGDIRRGLLKGIGLNRSVIEIMNQRPVTIPAMKNKKSVLQILKINKLRHLPVVDDSGIVIGIERLDDLIQPEKFDHWVLIMAGGLGKRLSPLTEHCPKPMLNIGGKPILETMLINLIEQGFRRFCVSVHYKAEQIQGYFGDGTKWGVEIRYIQEEVMLGTAGALSLLPVRTDKPILVMNGDILTKLSMDQMLNFHEMHQVHATVAVRSYDYQVPYGVIKASRDRLIGFEEKPVYSSLVNAGIYTINPEVIERIPKNQYYDMDQLLKNMLQEEAPLAVFPIREYWIDIGTMKEFNRAVEEYNEVFQ